MGVEAPDRTGIRQCLRGLYDLADLQHTVLYHKTFSSLLTPTGNVFFHLFSGFFMVVFIVVVEMVKLEIIFCLNKDVF